MIILANTSFGLIIGEKSQFGDGVITIKDPRQMIINTDKETKLTNFALGEFPWKPKLLNLPANHVYFDVQDEEIKKVYKQAVTGIVLASSGDLQKLN